MSGLPNQRLCLRSAATTLYPKLWWLATWILLFHSALLRIISLVKLTTSVSFLIASIHVCLGLSLVFVALSVLLNTITDCWKVLFYPIWKSFIPSSFIALFQGSNLSTRIWKSRSCQHSCSASKSGWILKVSFYIGYAFYVKTMKKKVEFQYIVHTLLNRVVWIYSWFQILVDYRQYRIGFWGSTRYYINPIISADIGADIANYDWYVDIGNIGIKNHWTIAIPIWILRFNHDYTW